MADFDPRQLDILEDALEGLDDLDDLDALDLAPALTERLGEYRDVLALCREAFPVEAPADELLANVITEAHEVSRRTRRHEGLAEGGSWRRFWERWRGTLVPGFALAATAAAVLFWLDPGETFEPHTATLANDEASQEQTEDRRADEREPESNQASQPASEREIDSTEAEPEPEPRATADDENTKLETQTQTGKPRTKKSKPPPTPAAAPPPEPMSKDETWISLERADAYRRKGSCDQARTHYEDIIAASTDSKAIGRAQAGIGLCFEQDRRESEAQKWFEDARMTSKGIDSWIEKQRDKQPRPGEKKKKPSKKSSAEPPGPVEAL